MYLLIAFSLLIFAILMTCCIKKYGIVESYSRYGLLYERNKEKRQTNWWSVGTIVSAMLMIPSCLELGDGNALQFLCFIAPINLLVIGFTPDFEKDKTTYIIHHIAGYLLGIVTILLSIYVFHNWWLLLIVIAAFIGAGLATRSVEKCYTLWAELAAYAYTYITLFVK